MTLKIMTAKEIHNNVEHLEKMGYTVPNGRWVLIESLHEYIDKAQKGTSSAIVCAYLATLRNELGDPK